MTERTIVLKALLKRRHLQGHTAFTKEYDKLAKQLDAELIGTYPSRAQFYRWISGELLGLPYAHHCRVLEAMFPGWTAERLFHEYDGTSLVPLTADQAEGSSTSVAEPDRSASHADVTAVYASRGAFAEDNPPRELFDGAQHIQLAGLSLNLLCQQYPDRSLGDLIESGTVVECLFLDPAGDHIAARDLEEGHEPGLLATLTTVNIHSLQRLRRRLSPDARSRLAIRIYDEIPRFNITIVDDTTCVVQPYLPDARGVESPTLVIERQGGTAGLFETFSQVFTALWGRAKEITE